MRICTFSTTPGLAPANSHVKLQILRNLSWGSARFACVIVPALCFSFVATREVVNCLP